jgi:ATP-dependent Clp protease ATP-binding subunit ClpC
VVILTSNLGFDAARRAGGLGFSSASGEASYERFRKQMMQEAKRVFKPELLNRFDDMVVFRQLDKRDVTKILDIEMTGVRKRLSALGVKLHLTASAKTFLVEKGLDPAMGARPLRRAIERYIEDPLAEDLLRGRFSPPCTLSTSAAENALSFKRRGYSKKKAEKTS